MQITDYGKKIKIALILRGRSQQWLVRAVRERTGRYFDAAYLQKLMTGAIATPGMLAAIDAILGIRADGSFQELFAWADAARETQPDEGAHTAQSSAACADAISPHTASAGPERPA